MKHFTLLAPCSEHGHHAVDALEIAPGLCVHRCLDGGEPGKFWCVAHRPSATVILFTMSESEALETAQAIATFADWTRSGRALEQDPTWKRRVMGYAMTKPFVLADGRALGFTQAAFRDPHDGNRHVDVRAN